MQRGNRRTGLGSGTRMWPIDYFRISHNILRVPPNFEVIVFKCSWENVVLPGAFQNNGLCKMFGENRVYCGGFDDRE